MSGFFGKGDKKKKADAEADAQNLSGDAPDDASEAAEEAPDVLDPEQAAAEQAPVEGEISPEAEAAEWKDKYVRSLAELENFRKRTERDRELGRRFASEELMRSLLPVLDALQHACFAEGDGEAIREGVKLAKHDLLRILSEKGMTEIEAEGQPFDPRFHEAMGMIPSPDHPAGTVMIELAKGYLVHDRVLRPSRVQIAAAPPPPPAQEDAPSDTPDHNEDQ